MSDLRNKQISSLTDPQPITVVWTTRNTVPAPKDRIRVRHDFVGMRFVVLALSTLCLTLGMCNSVALHFTVICMKEDANGTKTSSTTAQNGINL